MEILSFNETETHPRVDLVKGHVDFELMGQALVAKYDNPDFADSFIRYEYATFSEGITEEVADEIEGDEQATPTIEVTVALNRKPSHEDSEPVTILYYGNYSVPQG